jgi:hypothetical protein
LNHSTTYSVDVGDDATKAAEMARKLRVCRTSILTGRVFVSVKAAGCLCYDERMRIMRGGAKASTYIVQDHEEAT